MADDPPPPLPPPSLPPPGVPGTLSVPSLPAGPSPEDRTLGMLAHLLGLLTGFLGPLIIWLVRKDESPFVDYHGKEALNFQLSCLIVMLVIAAVTMVTFGLAIFVTAPLLLVIGVLVLVWEIQACCAANRGDYFRYPLNLRMIA